MSGFFPPLSLYLSLFVSICLLPALWAATNVPYANRHIWVPYVFISVDCMVSMLLIVLICWQGTLNSLWQFPVVISVIIIIISITNWICMRLEVMPGKAPIHVSSAAGAAGAPPSSGCNNMLYGCVWIWWGGIGGVFEGRLGCLFD